VEGETYLTAWPPGLRSFMTGGTRSRRTRLPALDFLAQSRSGLFFLNLFYVLELLVSRDFERNRVFGFNFCLPRYGSQGAKNKIRLEHKVSHLPRI
jgi:hypothetical protein